MAVEVEAAGLCALRRSKADAVDIRRRMEQVDAKRQDPKSTKVLYDFRFHLAIAKASKNPHIHRLLDTVAGLPDVRSLLLVGRLDMRTPLEDALKVKAQLPRSQIVVVPGNGHDQVDTDGTGCVAKALTLYTAGKRIGRPCAGRSNVATLGSSRDVQKIDALQGEYTDRFMLHYNFPPYATGEMGRVGSPKRREIGHGRLAKRALVAVLPSEQEYNNAMRVVSEITESNGSSSMASFVAAAWHYGRRSEYQDPCRRYCDGLDQGRQSFCGVNRYSG